MTPVEMTDLTWNLRILTGGFDTFPKSNRGPVGFGMVLYGPKSAGEYISKW